MAKQETLTAAEFQAQFGGKKPKGAKYRNKIVVVDGVRFHSQKEATHFGKLKLMVKAGLISDLCRQVPYRLVINGQKISTYWADMTYRDDVGQLHVIDVKSPPTRRLASYRTKKRWMEAQHGITITEV